VALFTTRGTCTKPSPPNHHHHRQQQLQSHVADCRAGVSLPGVAPWLLVYPGRTLAPSSSPPVPLLAHRCSSSSSFFSHFTLLIHLYPQQTTHNTTLAPSSSPPVPLLAHRCSSSSSFFSHFTLLIHLYPQTTHNTTHTPSHPQQHHAGRNAAADFGPAAQPRFSPAAPFASPSTSPPPPASLGRRLLLVLFAHPTRSPFSHRQARGQANQDRPGRLPRDALLCRLALVLVGGGIKGQRHEGGVPQHHKQQGLPPHRPPPRSPLPPPPSRRRAPGPASKRLPTLRPKRVRRIREASNDSLPRQLRHRRPFNPIPPLRHGPGRGRHPPRRRPQLDHQRRNRASRWHYLRQSRQRPLRC